MSTLQTGHVGLNVTDLARSTAFYRQVFDFEIFGEQTEGARRFAFLGRDGTLQVTLWQQSEGEFATVTFDPLAHRHSRLRFAASTLLAGRQQT